MRRAALCTLLALVAGGVFYVHCIGPEWLRLLQWPLAGLTLIALKVCK